VIDDADILLQRSGVEGEAFLVEALESFQGTLILSCRSDHRSSRQLARVAQHSVVLSIAKPEQAALWGGATSAIPGRGLWRGDVLQVGYPGPAALTWSPQVHPLERASTIVVTADHSRCVAFGVRSTLTLEEFTTASLGSMLGSTPPTVVWDGVNHREVRFATAGKTWIPPLDPPTGAYWVSIGGSPQLVRPADWLR
jgi:hypothetical protein